jgi:hypothetical protein
LSHAPRSVRLRVATMSNRFMPQKRSSLRSDRKVPGAMVYARLGATGYGRSVTAEVSQRHGSGREGVVACPRLADEEAPARGAEGLEADERPAPALFRRESSRPVRPLHLIGRVGRDRSPWRTPPSLRRARCGESRVVPPSESQDAPARPSDPRHRPRPCPQRPKPLTRGRRSHAHRRDLPKPEGLAARIFCVSIILQRVSGPRLTTVPPLGDTAVTLRPPSASLTLLLRSPFRHPLWFIDRVPFETATLSQRRVPEDAVCLVRYTSQATLNSSSLGRAAH